MIMLSWEWIFCVTVVREIHSLFTNQSCNVLQFADLEKQNCTQPVKVVLKDYKNVYVLSHNCWHLVRNVIILWWNDHA